MARGVSFLAVLFFAVAVATSAFGQQAADASSSLTTTDGGYSADRSLLAIKKKPTKRPTKAKLYTGAKACAKFSAGCSVCTKTACTACSTNFNFRKSSKKCSCKKGYVFVSKTKSCKLLPKPTKKPTRKPTKTPTKKAVTKPTSTSPPLQKEVADPKIAGPKALSKTCTGTTTGGLKFTILPGLFPFSEAARACKAAGLQLSDIDLIFSPASGAQLGNAAQETIAKCVGTSKAVWFDTSLAAPQCNAFVAQPTPSDGAPAAAGRKLSAASTVLLTQEVPTGCKTELPVLCV